MNQVAERIDRTNGIVPMPGNSVTPVDMLDRALSSGASVEVISKLMDLQERWEKSQARKAFDEAIALAKAEIPAVIRNKTGHNDKRYADFAAIAKAVDPVISKHGLTYRFRTTQTDRISVTCVLSHKAGHYEETTLAGPSDASGSKNAIQAIGSTLTYLQRYSLVQMLGLAVADDDDGKIGAAVSGLVSDEQYEELKTLIAHVGADIRRFCDIFKIASVDQLPRGRFEEAKRRLENYGKQQGVS